uniref:Uncharacterized protein n=1 Tax=Anguilla anguilla TaxID=7936 RepID=A0A0E9UVB1_ANGAN
MLRVPWAKILRLTFHLRPFKIVASQNQLVKIVQPYGASVAMQPVLPFSRH